MKKIMSLFLVSMLFIFSSCEDFPYDNIIPTIQNPMGIMNLQEDFDPFTINLDKVFSDAESMTYKIDSQQNTSVSVQIDENILYVRPVENSYSDLNKTTIRATNTAGNSVTDVLTINVANVNDAPAFTTSGVEIAQEGEVYTYNIVTKDADNAELTISVPTKPSWLNFTQTGDKKATLTGTPSANDIGNNPVVITVTDGESSVNQEFSINVADVDQEIEVTLVLPSAGGNVTMNENETEEFLINAIDPDGNELIYTWKLNGDVVSSISSYTFVADYTMSGNYTLTLTVSDGASDSVVSLSWAIVVLNVNRAPVISNIVPQTGDEGSLLTFNVNATDPDGDNFTFSLGQGALAGMSINQNSGEFSWTPNYQQAGDYNVEIFATDNGIPAQNGSATASITINNTDQPIIVNNILPSAGGDIELEETESENFSIAAFDPDGNDLVYSWKLDETEVATTPNYSFTTDYTSAGNYTLILTVTDNSRNTISYTWNIVVNDVDRPIEVSDLTPATQSGNTWITINQNILESESVDFSITAVDPDGNDLVYSWKLNGNEVSTTSSYQLVSDFTMAGNHTVSLSVTDNFGSDNSINYAWSVNIEDVDRPIEVSDLSPATQSGNTWTPTNQNILESESIDFSITAVDPDGNDLVYSWKLNGNEVSTTSSYQLVTDYTMAGNHNVSLSVTDNFGSRNTINYTWLVNVENVDRAPMITPISPQSVVVGNLLSFTAVATDPDGDMITYTIGDGFVAGMNIHALTGDFSWTPDTVGDYEVDIISSSNGGSGILSDTTTVDITVLEMP